jgi:hypothetical protein
MLTSTFHAKRAFAKCLACIAVVTFAAACSEDNGSERSSHRGRSSTYTAAEKAMPHEWATGQRGREVPTNGHSASPREVRLRGALADNVCFPPIPDTGGGTSAFDPLRTFGTTLKCLNSRRSAKV